MKLKVAFMQPAYIISNCSKQEQNLSNSHNFKWLTFLCIDLVEVQLRWS